MEALDLSKLMRLHEAQKKAKRDYYHRHKETINEKRRVQYEEEKKRREGGVAEGGVAEGGVLVV